MKWKEFLKPTKKKILLAVILLIVSILIGTNSICFWPEHNPECSTSMIGNIFGTITLVYFAIYLFIATSFGFVAFVIIPLYYYLISCGVIFLYKKVKNSFH